MRYPVTLIRPLCVPEAVQYLPSQPYVTQVTLSQALDVFVESKYKENILGSTVRQLAQRSRHFITFTQHQSVNQTNTSSALFYRNLLLSEGRSHQTNKEYLVEISLFIKWKTLGLLYQGLRPGEACQLHKDDIIE